MWKYRVLFNTGDGAGEGTGGTGGTGAGAAASAKAPEAPKDDFKAKYEELQRQHETLTKQLGHTRNLFDGTKSEEERAASARETLKALGHADADIEKWVRENITGEGQGDGAAPTEPSSDDELKETKRIALDARKSQLNKHFEDEVTKALDSGDSLAKLIQAGVALQGKDKSGAIRAAMKESLEDRVRDAIRSKVATSRDPISESMITEVVNNAKSQVYKQFAAVIADPTTLGRSTETSGRGPNTPAPKPLPAPTYNAAKSLGEVEAETEKWFARELEILAANTPDDKANRSNLV